MLFPFATNNAHQELPQIANEANRIRESADAKTKELMEKNAELNKRIVELNAKLNTNAKKQAEFGKEAKKVTDMAKEKITDQSQALQDMEVSCYVNCRLLSFLLLTSSSKY